MSNAELQICIDRFFAKWNGWVDCILIISPGGFIRVSKLANTIDYDAVDKLASLCAALVALTVSYIHEFQSSHFDYIRLKSDQKTDQYHDFDNDPLYTLLFPMDNAILVCVCFANERLPLGSLVNDIEDTIACLQSVSLQIQ
jgi:hypothetical protein